VTVQNGAGWPVCPECGYMRCPKATDPDAACYRLAAARCGCPTNGAGDIHCHVCRERVNVRCWNCQTPRGEGPCPNPIGEERRTPCEADHMTIPPFDIAVPDHVDLIVTHGGCHDGFTAEWLLHQRWPNAECHPGAYGEDITDLVALGNRLRDKLANGEVIVPGDEQPTVLIMADFSYKLPEMLMLALAWDRIILLDHHESAVKTLWGALPANVECVFDMERSGAGLVADWLGVLDARHAGFWPEDGTLRETCPLVNYVEDRDLWRFDLPDSKEAIQYLIAATPHTYEDWAELNSRLRDSLSYQRCVEEGTIVGRYHHLIVDELVDCARPAVIDGHDVLITPSPYMCGSDVAGQLAKLSPSGIGAYYRDLPDRREYGLRSGPDGPDVAAIAGRLEGGGHRHASGYRTNLPA
jgi:uncharacterized protein